MAAGRGQPPQQVLRTWWGGACSGRHCRGEALVRARAESVRCSGSLSRLSNHRGRRGMYNHPPATGFVKEDVGTGAAILLAHVHTRPHTRQLHLYLMNREHPPDITFLFCFVFPQEVTRTGGKKDTALTTESLEASPQIVRQPHEFLGTDSTGKPLSMQTSSNANVAPLALPCPHLGPHKAPPLGTESPHCVETRLPLRGSGLSPPKLAPQGASRRPLPSPLMASGSCAHP